MNVSRPDQFQGRHIRQSCFDFDSFLLMTCGRMNILQKFCSFCSAFLSPLHTAYLEGAEEVEVEEVEEAEDVGGDCSPAYFPPALGDLRHTVATVAAVADPTPPLRDFLGPQGLRLRQYSLPQDLTGPSSQNMQEMREFSKGRLAFITDPYPAWLFHCITVETTGGVPGIGISRPFWHMPGFLWYLDISLAHARFPLVPSYFYFFGSCQVGGTGDKVWDNILEAWNNNVN